MSKLEAGETEIPDTAFDLTELLCSVNREAQIKAEEKNVSYAVDWERGIFRSSVFWEILFTQQDF